MGTSSLSTTWQISSLAKIRKQNEYCVFNMTPVDKISSSHLANLPVGKITFQPVGISTSWQNHFPNQLAKSPFNQLANKSAWSKNKCVLKMTSRQDLYLTAKYSLFHKPHWKKSKSISYTPFAMLEEYNFDIYIFNHIYLYPLEISCKSRTIHFLKGNCIRNTTIFSTIDQCNYQQLSRKAQNLNIHWHNYSDLRKTL